MWVTHKHSRSVRALVIVNHSVALNLKSFVGLKTGHKKIYIATYHDLTMLGDYAVWPGVISYDVRRSDLVNKHIKRGIIISIQLKIKFIGFDWF